VNGRVLVTGATGFVGRALVADLLQTGNQVRAATRDPATAALPPDAEVVAVPDFRAPVDWAPLLDGVDAVVHAAGIAHVGPAVAADDYDRVVHQATAELANACAQTGVRRLVFVSSIRAQSGAAAGHVLRETDAPHPTEPYGRAKLRAEAAVRKAAVTATILRPVMVYGPGVKGNLASLMRLAATPLPLPFASFACKRSLVSLDNLISAIRFALDAPEAAGETYIVADPDPVSLAEIIAALRSGAGRSPGLVPMPPAGIAAALKLIGRADAWERLGGALVADPGKLIAAGWQPEADTGTGLARMMAAQRASMRR
jgi:nucleoside-diphosphate-sugar epimerase